MNRTSHELVVFAALEALFEIMSDLDDLEGKLPDVQQCYPASIHRLPYTC